jgi:cell division protein FtsL
MADSRKSRPKYRMVYTEGSAAPRLEPVPEKKPEPSRRTRRQQEQIRARQNIARRNQQHALRFNRSYLLFLAAVVLICVVGCSVLVSRRTAVTASMQQVSALQEEVSSRKADNDALEKQLQTSVNLNSVKKKARKLGLSYPSSKQVVYFSVNQKDYMTQLEKSSD